MIGGDALHARFSYHAPDADRIERHSDVRSELLEVAQKLDDWIPDGREKSLALTKLEEVMFWSNAAIARSA